MAKHELTFNLVGTTKGTGKYMEAGDETQHKVGQLYVKKGAFPSNTPTQVIKVTIEV